MYDRVNFLYKTPNREVQYTGTITGMSSANKNSGEYYLIKADTAGTFRVDVDDILSTVED
jgi:hypothetical protein